MSPDEWLGRCPPLSMHRRQWIMWLEGHITVYCEILDRTSRLGQAGEGAVLHDTVNVDTSAWPTWSISSAKS